jgi:hypothetical protein
LDVASHPALAAPASPGVLRRLQQAARLLLGPLALVPDTAKLAQAGFYFDGELHGKTYSFFFSFTPHVICRRYVIFFYLSAWEDMTTCFLCGGTLTQWLAKDDGWFEQGVYYTRCMFVRYCKGDDFIASCEKEYKRRCHDRDSK